VKPDAETIGALLALRRKVDPDLRAIVTTDDAVTYAELDDASAAVASRLVADGMVKGDRVGLLAPNGIEWAVTALAVLRIGAVLVPLSTLLRPPELMAQLTAASVSHLVTVASFRDRRYLEDLEAAAPGLPSAVRSGTRHPSAPSLRRLWLTTELPERVAPAGMVAALEARVRPADDLSILFTSGSRGAPKGVIHTHGAALRATAAGLDARRVGPGERLYIPMPFFWTGGFSCGLLSALVAGATLLTEAEPEAARTLELLQREHVTLFRGWPDQAARLAAHPAFAHADLSSLRDGSLPAVLPPDRRPAPGGRAFMFGMTETFGPYCGDRLDTDLPPGKAGSCGRPFDGIEVRIVDPERGSEQPPGEAGEIWLRGPNLMRGICGCLRSTVFTPDGAYRTGDLGRLDADGYLWYTGRLDDMVKVKGATVYPSEVESALRAVQGVREAHVTDVPDDDGRPEVGALVVTGETVEVIRDALHERLSAFKMPTRWLVTAESAVVPTLASGKVDKAALQRLLGTEGRRAPARRDRSERKGM
jgi:acyl-CoA synthetase (AMP-forming)/AMP-acid ligase II